MPTLKGVLIHMWERSSFFLRKAGIIIVLVAIILWFLMNIPWGVENTRDSLFGKMSAAIAPILAPAGFGNWEAAGALVTGFVAKEVVVGTMSQIYVGEAEEEEEEETALIEALQNSFTPLSAVAFNVFVLLYIPCMVAIAAQRHEYGTKWMLFNAGYLTALGWVVSTLIYQVGSLLGIG
ncbi:MAG: nucleoside recognition domain-containing protein [Candidatus Humimicrobiia bacterium]